MEKLDDSQLVNGPRLLKLLFAEEGRPSLRWLREQQKRRVIPYIKIGHRVYFDPVKVRSALDQRNTVKHR